MPSTKKRNFFYALFFGQRPKVEENAQGVNGLTKEKVKNEDDARTKKAKSKEHSSPKKGIKERPSMKKTVKTKYDLKHSKKKRIKAPEPPEELIKENEVQGVHEENEVAIRNPQINGCAGDNIVSKNMSGESEDNQNPSQVVSINSEEGKQIEEENQRGMIIDNDTLVAEIESKKEDAGMPNKSSSDSYNSAETVEKHAANKESDILNQSCITPNDKETQKDGEGESKVKILDGTDIEINSYNSGIVQIDLDEVFPLKPTTLTVNIEPFENKDQLLSLESGKETELEATADSLKSSSLSTSLNSLRNSSLSPKSTCRNTQSTPITSDISSIQRPWSASPAMISPTYSSSENSLSNDRKSDTEHRADIIHYTPFFRVQLQNNKYGGLSPPRIRRNSNFQVIEKKMDFENETSTLEGEIASSADPALINEYQKLKNMFSKMHQKDTEKPKPSELQAILGQLRLVNEMLESSKKITSKSSASPNKRPALDKYSFIPQTLEMNTHPSFNSPCIHKKNIQQDTPLTHHKTNQINAPKFQQKQLPLDLSTHCVNNSKLTNAIANENIKMLQDESKNSHQNSQTAVHKSIHYYYPQIKTKCVPESNKNQSNSTAIIHTKSLSYDDYGTTNRALNGSIPAVQKAKDKRHVEQLLTHPDIQKSWVTSTVRLGSGVKGLDRKAMALQKIQDEIDADARRQRELKKMRDTLAAQGTSNPKVTTQSNNGRITETQKTDLSKFSRINNNSSAHQKAVFEEEQSSPKVARPNDLILEEIEVQQQREKELKRMRDFLAAQDSLNLKPQSDSVFDPTFKGTDLPKFSGILTKNESPESPINFGMNGKNFVQHKIFKQTQNSLTPSPLNDSMFPKKKPAEVKSPETITYIYTPKTAKIAPKSTSENSNPATPKVIHKLSTRDIKQPLSAENDYLYFMRRTDEYVNKSSKERTDIRNSNITLVNVNGNQSSSQQKFVTHAVISEYLSTPTSITSKNSVASSAAPSAQSTIATRSSTPMKGSFTDALTTVVKNNLLNSNENIPDKDARATISINHRLLELPLNSQTNGDAKLKPFVLPPCVQQTKLKSESSVSITGNGHFELPVLRKVDTPVERTGFQLGKVLEHKEKPETSTKTCPTKQNIQTTSTVLSYPSESEGLNSSSILPGTSSTIPPPPPGPIPNLRNLPLSTTNSPSSSSQENSTYKDDEARKIKICKNLLPISPIDTAKLMEEMKKLHLRPAAPIQKVKQTDAREDLLEAIRNAGGIKSLKKVLQVGKCLESLYK